MAWAGHANQKVMSHLIKTTIFLVTHDIMISKNRDFEGHDIICEQNRDLGPILVRAHDPGLFRDDFFDAREKKFVQLCTFCREKSGTE